MELIARSLQHHAASRPDRPALVSGSTTLTYGELWSHASSCAAWLATRNVRAQDRVIILGAPDDPWCVVAYFGAHLACAIAVPLDFRTPQATIDEIVARVDPALVIDGTQFSILKQSVLEPAPGADDPASALARLSLDDPADLLFTSGSTGRPKGVMLTHRNIAAATQNIIAFIGNDSSDREVCTVPLNHSFGLGRMRCNIVAGGTLILVPGLRFPALVFKALLAHQATGLSCVPSGLAVLLRVAGEGLAERTGALRYMELGSERMDAPAKRELARLLSSTRICMHYGLTEASRSAFMEFHQDSQHLDSVGKAVGSVLLAVCDEAGTELEPGVTGRILVKGPTVMESYWRDPERTRAAVDDRGWFDTGDLGYLDAAGYLYLQGRSDDVINVGGRKVYPDTVEEAALQFPGVVEAACVASPDPEGLVAEVPALYVVTAEAAPLDAAALIRHLEERIERHAVPRHIRGVGTLPRTASGKLQRAVLRAMEFREAGGA